MKFEGLKIGMLLLIAALFTSSVIAADPTADQSYEIMDLMRTYYDAFAQKDVDTFYNTMFIYHLSDEEAVVKYESSKILIEAVDVLSYSLDSVEISVTDDVAIITYFLNSDLGSNLGTEMERYDFGRSMTATLIKDGRDWKIFMVQPTEMFDYATYMFDSLDTEYSQYNLAEEETLFSKVGNFFVKLAPQIFRPRPKTCGNYVCDAGETKNNCVEDCVVISYSSTCGNDICDSGETTDSCPYDCKTVPEEPIVEEAEPVDEKTPTAEETKSKKESDDTDDVEQPEEVNKTEEPLAVELDFCGDGVCKGNETCYSCLKDCACLESEVCFNEKCYAPKCFNDDGCDDDDSCTKNVCKDEGEAWARCSYEKIKKCKDDDGCCPGLCDPSSDSDCSEEDKGNNAEEDENEDDSGSVSDSSQEEENANNDWNTGTLSNMAKNLGEDHLFFDFSARSTTTSFSAGDIFFNGFGDLMGECHDGSCVELKEETSLGFDEMLDPPSSGYSGDASIDQGKKYWIKTLEGKDAKIEITSVSYEDDEVSSISFKWGYRP